GPADSCRVYGSLELNKVQGDFHITARGHGYMEMGAHLEHESKFEETPVVGGGPATSRRSPAGSTWTTWCVSGTRGPSGGGRRG
ncbi:hypothetical protein FS847_35425, partial [Streptomyces sp. ISID311]